MERLSEAEVAAATWHDRHAEIDVDHEMDSSCWCCCWHCEQDNPYFEQAHAAMHPSLDDEG